MSEDQSPDDAPEPGPAMDLRPFIKDGTLSRLPAKQARRQTVLAHLVSSGFAPEQVYTEAQVNEILGRLCEGGEVDHVTIRRYLIDARLLSRSNGQYAVDPALLEGPDQGQRYLDAIGLH